MDIEQFQEIFPVPSQPVEAAESGKWHTFEDELSVQFPGDYKRFIELYGTGCIGMFVWIFNPFSDNENLNLMKQIDSQTEQYRQARSELGEKYCPFPIFPEPAGLLPCGVTDNGDVFFWLMASDNPDDWQVVINETRSPEFETHSKQLTEFLAGVVTGEIESQIIPHDFIDQSRLFLPVDQVSYE